jgi:hypothetical protein
MRRTMARRLSRRTMRCPQGRSTLLNRKNYARFEEAFLRGVPRQVQILPLHRAAHGEIETAVWRRRAGYGEEAVAGSTP